jgi:hypothetical protein
MFYISVFHSDRFLQELLLIIEDMESRWLDIILYQVFLDPWWASLSSSSRRFLWNNCSLQRKTDHSWTCSINCNKLLHAELLDRRSEVWYHLFVFHFLIDSCIIEDMKCRGLDILIFGLILDDELHHRGDCCLHLIIFIDLRCMICSEEFVLSNECVLVRVTLRSKTLAMYLCVSRSKVYSPCILSAFQEHLRTCNPNVWMLEDL